MIVRKQIFCKVGPKTKSRRKVVHDMKKVEKYCSRASRMFFARRATENLFKKKNRLVCKREIEKRKIDGYLRLFILRIVGCCRKLLRPSETGNCRS